MLLACVASSGMRAFALVEGRLDSVQYQQILEANAAMSAQSVCLFNTVLF